MLPFPNSTLLSATRPHHPQPATKSKNCQGMTFHQVRWCWGNHHHQALDVPVPNLHVWQCRLYVCKYCRTMDRALSCTPGASPPAICHLPLSCSQEPLVVDDHKQQPAAQKAEAGTDQAPRVDDVNPEPAADDQPPINDDLDPPDGSTES